ncbi:hypothetical protein J43TS3_09830 [Ornithinibacillus bavariensis]|uniref:Uncharacterized protein n=1 Tax=Ornithinibacillus bavariensis TaxID=545502 RepID=A0A919X5N8_9BACI|nr:hypothetical protein J43TS3_09830 [Ornithinibacillus bavariensis]
MVGFITVVVTILYQVLLENGEVSNGFYNTISSIWSAATLMFIFMNFIFILVSLLIFFGNSEGNEVNSNEDVYELPLENSPFK